MVKAALKPLYQKNELDKDAYTEINRDISRLMYEKVGGANGLTDQSARERWQRLANTEVEAAIKAKKKEGPATKAA